MGQLYTDKCCCVVYNNNKLEINSSLFIKYITVHPYVLISYSLERVVEKRNEHSFLKRDKIKFGEI